MCYIPDPTELMDAREARAIEEWKACQDESGMYVCPFCKKHFDYEPIAMSADPASQVGCYECLDDAHKLAYDKWEESNASAKDT